MESFVLKLNSPMPKEKPLTTDSYIEAWYVRIQSLGCYWRIGDQIRLLMSAIFEINRSYQCLWFIKLVVKKRFFTTKYRRKSTQNDLIKMSNI